MTKIYQILVLALLATIAVFSILSYITLVHMDSNTDPIFNMTLEQYKDIGTIKNILDR